MPLIMSERMEEMIRLHRTSMQKNTAAEYEHAIETTMFEIAPFLPKANRWKKRIIDIGCGMAGIDLMLHRHYKDNAEIVLLDRDGVEKDKPLGKFHQSASEFGSSGCLDLASRFLQANRVPESDIKTVNIDSQPFPDGRFDIIISLLSMGFHYPVSTYDIKNALKPSGIIILDIRKERLPDAKKILGSSCELMTEGAKHFRMVWHA